MINEVSQQSSTGALLELFDIDFSLIGQGIGHYVADVDGVGADIAWRGNTYQPIPLEAKGFEWTSQGTLPTPTLSISNILGTFSALLSANGDPIGCKVTRWKTFEQFLDNGAQANPDVHFPVDVYYIERKAGHNGMLIEYELAASIDVEGVKIPSRQILRNTCAKLYRVYDEVQQVFSYERATCPYSGANYFNEQGAVTTDALDLCGKKLSDCQLRYSNNEPLPFGGFPGVAKNR